MWSSVIYSLVFLLCSVLSLEQLGFNALLQLMIGVPLEMVHGILRISLLYMAGVLAGECHLKYFLLHKPAVSEVGALRHCLSSIFLN